MIDLIDYDKMRAVVCAGLKTYLQCPVQRSNQNEAPPSFPYVSYTVTRVMSENNGTYGVYEDGAERKAVTQTWSITVLSDDNTESVTLAVKAREWLDRVGTTYLNDNGVIVQSVGGITNRDNFLATGYEYRNGFDVVFWLFDTIQIDEEVDGRIDSVQLYNGEFIEGENMEKTIENLTSRIDVMGAALENVENAIDKVESEIAECVKTSDLVPITNTEIDDILDS